MLFIDSFQIVLLLLFVIEKGTGILFPDLCLLTINFLLLNLFLSFLFYLSSQIVSHLGFLLFSNLFASFLLLFLLSQLVFNVSHHLLILCSDLLLLVFDYRICERSHNSLDLFFTFFFLFLSLSFKLILEPSIFLLRFDILNRSNDTSVLYLYASYLNLLWFSSFSTITYWNLCLYLYFLSLNYLYSSTSSSFIFSTNR